MMSNEHRKHSLDAPWTGPWKALRRGPKTYTIDWKGKAYTVSIVYLQPACILSDFNQSCHDVSRSASPNNHTRLSAAQMSRVSPLFLLRAMHDAIRHPSPSTSLLSQPRRTRTRVVRRPDRYTPKRAAALSCTYSVCILFVSLLSLCHLCFCLMQRPFSVHAQLRHAVTHRSAFFSPATFQRNSCSFTR